MGRLVLTAKEGESIIVADSVRVTVVKMQGDKVRICFEADSDIPIDRESIHLKKKQRKAESC